MCNRRALTLAAAVTCAVAGLPSDVPAQEEAAGEPLMIRADPKARP